MGGSAPVAERVDGIRERDDHLVGSDILDDLGVLFQDNAPHVGSMATTTRLEDSCRTSKRKKFHHTIAG